MQVSNTQNAPGAQDAPFTDEPPRWRDVLVVDSAYYRVTPRQERLRIVARVAEKHGMTIGDIRGKSRLQAHVDARWEAIQAVRLAFPDDSFPQLGRLFNRDHTTIMHALATMAREAAR